MDTLTLSHKEDENDVKEQAFLFQLQDWPLGAACPADWTWTVCVTLLSVCSLLKTGQLLSVFVLETPWFDRISIIVSNSQNFHFWNLCVFKLLPKKCFWGAFHFLSGVFVTSQMSSKPHRSDSPDLLLGCPLSDLSAASYVWCRKEHFKVNSPKPHFYLSKANISLYLK